MIGPGIDLLNLAQQNTWAFITVMYVGAYLLHREIQDNGSDIQSNGQEIEAVADKQQALKQQITQIDVKQDHITERQNRVVDAVDANEDEIQDIKLDQSAPDAEPGAKRPDGGVTDE